MKNKFLFKIINKCIKKLKKNKLFYGQGTYNEYSESIHLIYSILNLNIYKKYNKININIKNIKKIFYLINKRIKYKIPIAYLTKNVWFCKKKFYIDKRAIIPRSPISEIIINKFKFIKKKNYYPKKILDLCTGSGCIAISCSYIFPKSKIDASDISNKALKVAQKNINIHKKKNIKLIKSNLFKNIYQKYDLIISNPPYVNYFDIKYLPKEYLFEPKIGLFTKQKGIYIIQKIIKNYKKYLKKNGILICEIGNQKNKIKKKNKNIKFKWIKINNINNNIFYLKN